MLSPTPSVTKAFIFKCFAPKPRLWSKTREHQPLATFRCTFSDSASLSPLTEFHMGDGSEETISLQEWQGWGTMSPLPNMVAEIVKDLKVLERDIDSQMSFGGNGGKLQEDKKHRATYQALGDSEKKLQFYAARQIACRLLGSRGYLCQKCWLPMEEDCMCSKVPSCSLWAGIRFWLYMHPKDFLRQNNTGKLMWQVFGVEAATLCLFGISEHEEIMWNSFKLAGKSNVWCLYPNKSAALKSVQDAFGQEPVANFELTQAKTQEARTMNFILIDGTWSNSGAMFKRLQDRANSVWRDEDLPCISLAPGASAMHKLRPQPAWDRTCTAAAAAGLLSELHFLPHFSSLGLDKQVQAVEDALTVLLEALTARRIRMDEIFESGASNGRSLLQAKKECSVDFENQNYTILISQCKGPQYPPKLCCEAFKQFACPFADEINDLTTNCATTMFSYINVYGKYPPSLFADECQEGKQGLNCSQFAAPPSSNSGQVATLPSLLLITTAGFQVFFFHLF